MKKLLSVLIPFVFILSGSLGATTADATSDAQMLRRYSLDQMAAAQNVLRASLEGENLCGLDPASQAQLPQLLQSLIDQKAASLNLQDWVKDSTKLMACETRCRCAFYDTLAVSEPVKKSNGGVPLELVTLLQAVKKKAEKPLSKAAVVGCAKNNAWVCQSSLLAHLQAQTVRE